MIGWFIIPDVGSFTAVMTPAEERRASDGQRVRPDAR